MKKRIMYIICLVLIVVLGACDSSIEDMNPMNRILELADEDKCCIRIAETTNIPWANYGSTMMGDDGYYFDEIVLGAWYDDKGKPKADYLPITISNQTKFYDPKISNLRFINGEKYSIDSLKRASASKKEIYAMILVDIDKQKDEYGYSYFIGYDYFTTTPIVIHGEFSGILNGDDILVFAVYEGLAEDDTPNFTGVYIEMLNDKGLSE